MQIFIAALFINSKTKNKSTGEWINYLTVTQRNTIYSSKKKKKATKYMNKSQMHCTTERSQYSPL